MADLDEKTSSSSTKIAGANPATGVESFYVNVDSNGSLFNTLKDPSGTSITSTTVSTKTGLDVAVFTSLPAGSNTIGGVLGSTPTGTSLFPVTGILPSNSTSTPLGSSAVYTGSWYDAAIYSNASVTIFTDQASATNGFQIQHSSDGTNVDDSDTFTIPASDGRQFSFPLPGRYFRIVYTNGSVAQTIFRLQTKLHAVRPKPSFFRVSDTFNDQQDVELVKSVQAGQNPDNIFVNQRAQGSNSLNSTTTLLSANGVYRGSWFQWEDKYVRLISAVTSNVSGTLFIDFSESAAPTDGVDNDIDASVAIPFNVTSTSLVRRATPLQSKWVRHRYINGTTAQSQFVLSASFLTTDSGISAGPLNVLPSVDSFAGVVRSVNTIPNTTGTAYVDVPVATDGAPKSYVTHIQDDILIEPLSGASASQTLVGTSPVQVDASPISNRRVISIFNEGPVRIAVGHSSSITFDSGSIRVSPGSSRTFGIDSTVPVYAIAENIGGSQNTLQRAGSSATGTATNPSNALVSDNAYAVISAVNQNVNVSGFTAGITNTLVSVKIGVEGNKAAGVTNVVAFQEVQTGFGGNVTSVTTTNSLTAATNHLYLAAITRRATTATVTSVTGLGLIWTQVSTRANGTSGVVDVWFALGTPTGSGVVSANFATGATNCHIAVHRYSNVNPTVPIQTFQSLTGTNATPTTATLTATANGMAYMAVFGANRTYTQGAGYTLDSSDLTNAAGNSDSLYTQHKPITVSGSETPTGTLSGNANWAAISIAITPSDATDPIVRASYTLSAVAGATTGDLTFTLGTDTTKYVDITPDRTWTVSNIPNLALIVTGQTIGNAAANIDRIFLELVDTTGNTSRVSVWQGGKAVT